MKIFSAQGKVSSFSENPNIKIMPINSQDHNHQKKASDTNAHTHKKNTQSLGKNQTAKDKKINPICRVNTSSAFPSQTSNTIPRKFYSFTHHHRQDVTCYDKQMQKQNPQKC